MRPARRSPQASCFPQLQRFALALCSDERQEADTGNVKPLCGLFSELVRERCGCRRRAKEGIGHGSQMKRRTGMGKEYSTHPGAQKKRSSCRSIDYRYIMCIQAPQGPPDSTAAEDTAGRAAARIGLRRGRCSMALTRAALWEHQPPPLPPQSRPLLPPLRYPAAACAPAPWLPGGTAPRQPPPSAGGREAQELHRGCRGRAGRRASGMQLNPPLIPQPYPWL